MLTNEQIEAISEDWEDIYGPNKWVDLEDYEKEQRKESIAFAANKAIAIQAEQDRRSFIAVGKYIGVSFTSETDVVSEVYKKLEEIMSVFREHSQEIAIAQNIKNLTNLLEGYVEQQTTPICSGAMGEEAGRPVCAGEGSSTNPQS